jgi:uncharacterized phiE125 gp8 family phage protein
MAIERIYLSRGNLINVTLEADGVASDISAASRMTLQIGSTTLDSATTPTVFDWTTSGASGILILDLGAQSIAAGDYDATLTIYDATYTTGLIWGDIPLTVEATTTPAAGTGPGLALAPTIEPVGMEEMRLHLGVDGSDNDDLIEALIVTAREHAEDVTWRKIMTQTWVICLDEWPIEDYIELPYGNLQSVSSVKWKDSDGTETTLTPTTDYLVEKNGDQKGRIVLPYGESWPSGELYPSNPITITFVCGWATRADVPKKIRHAIKMIVADLYLHRGDRITGLTVTENHVAQSFLGSLKLW